MYIIGLCSINHKITRLLKNAEQSHQRKRNGTNEMRRILLYRKMYFCENAQAYA